MENVDHLSISSSWAIFSSDFHLDLRGLHTFGAPCSPKILHITISFIEKCK